MRPRSWSFATASSPTPDVGATASVAALFAGILGRSPVTGSDTFVGLGGDSLSYVECSIRLEERLGHVPHDWHVTPVAELERCSGTKRSAMTHVLDTTVLLRAFSICAVVSTSTCVSIASRAAPTSCSRSPGTTSPLPIGDPHRTTRLTSSSYGRLRFGAPVSAWIGLNMLVTGRYSLGAFALVNNYTGSDWRRNGRWEYWFFEVFVQLLLLSSLLLAVPAVRKVERRVPFTFATIVVVPLLVLRFRWIEFGGMYNHVFRTHTVAWFFGLGWMIAAASRRWQRVLVTVLGITAAVPGLLGRGQREAFIIAGLVLMTWVPSIPMPRVLRRPIGELASSSMWIFLVHWQVWPILDTPLKREVAYVLTIAVGVLVGRSVRRWSPALRSLASRPRAVSSRAATTTMDP